VALDGTIAETEGADDGAEAQRAGVELELEEEESSMSSRTSRRVL
jgi:hypothetical protein